MRCPTCGEEIKEGYLYCEHCGTDIHIVPDFEPELENNIQETLQNIVGNVSVEEGQELADEWQLSRMHPEKRKNRFLIFACMVPILLILAVVLVGGVIRYQNTSLEYQLDKAYACLAKGDSEGAISYYQRALELDNRQISLWFELAEIYRTLGQQQDYLNLLQEIADASFTSQVDAEKAYDRMIAYYKEQENYIAINTLLLACPLSEVVSANQNYMANPPEFSYPEGAYAEVVPLKLSSNTAGSIYYTTDGSIPNEQSNLYTAPIFLETGDYVISAVFVNDYGIVSDVAKRQYHIEVMRPAAPEVEVYSGDYTTPTMIVVDVHPGCSVYYTTDGTIPTNQSTLYRGAIPMPLGQSQYRFISYNLDGVCGDTTYREYNLTLTTTITPDMASLSIVEKMMERGKIYDHQGHAYDVEGRYRYLYQAVVPIIDQGDFYLIAEVYEDTAGVQSKTGTQYAVNIYNGACYKATEYETGNYLLEEF